MSLILSYTSVSPVFEYCVVKLVRLLSNVVCGIAFPTFSPSNVVVSNISPPSELTTSLFPSNSTLVPNLSLIKSPGPLIVLFNVILGVHFEPGLLDLIKN